MPAGFLLRADSGTRLIAGGSVLVGGSPVRVLRLTPAGGRQVADWLAGSPVPAGLAARKLARRLLDAGIAHPDVAARADDRQGAGSSQPSIGGTAPADSGAAHVRPGPWDVTVVIPVRDRHAELARCLAGVRAQSQITARSTRVPGGARVPGAARAPGGARTDPRELSVIVVDDASADPAAIAAIAAEHGAMVIHRQANGGPGAARNTGLAAAPTGLVAFLDSDCVPRPGWLDRLLPHFADPAVGAVAPRIVPHAVGTGWLARYEGASSTLDMGARPSIVRPGARVSYVPGAALVVRKTAAVPGFIEGMFVGEDVDFIWRMSASGWRVRYEPAATMGHDHRVAFRAWFSRRADYGTSAAALEELHPGAVRPLYASWWTVGAWAAALSGRPVAAATLTATATALLARRLSRVTGERWPIPASPPASPPAPPLTPPPAPSPALADNSKKLPAPSLDADNSKKNPVLPRRSGLAGKILEVLRAHSTLNSHQEKSFHGPARPDNSKKCLASTSRADNSKKCSAPSSPVLGKQKDNSKRRSAPGRSAASGPDNSKMRAGAAWVLAVRLAGGGSLAAGRPLGSAMSRTWWPLAVPAAIAFPGLRRPVAALILAPPLLDWVDRRPPLDPARYVAARLLDDAAYSIGVWQGCLARRTLRPLLPVLGNGRPQG